MVVCSLFPFPLSCGGCCRHQLCWPAARAARLCRLQGPEDSLGRFSSCSTARHCSFQMTSALLTAPRRRAGCTVKSAQYPKHIETTSWQAAGTDPLAALSLGSLVPEGFRISLFDRSYGMYECRHSCKGQRLGREICVGWRRQRSNSF